MLKRLAFSLVLCGLLVSRAGAADTVPPTPPPAATTADADQLAEKLKVLDPKTNPHLAKAMEFCEVAGVKSLMAQQADKLVPLMISLMQSESSNKDSKYWANITQIVSSLIKEHLDDLILLSADVYAEHFNDTELDELIAFYNSDVGKKYLVQRPELYSEETAVAQLWGKAIGEQYLKEQQAKQPTVSKSSL